MAEQIDSKIPKIRFKGFEGEWEDKTLGDLGSFKNGMNFGKEAMGHGNPFVNLQNVFGQFEVDDKKLELAESSSVQRREYNLLKGDVLFIRSSVKPEGVGETALITKTLMDTTYSGFIIRYRPEVMMSHDFNRIAYRTTVVRKQILANASRSANTNINQNALKKIALGIPSFEEQTQIGGYFRELDRLIGLHQRKHAKLVALKKAMLQKMFPQPGATTPEIRFKGFSEDWNKEKLETISDSYSGGTPSVGNRAYYGGAIPFIRSAEINAISTELTITELGLRDSAAKMVSEGDILYALYGATSGEVGISQINGAINQAVLAIKPHSGYSSQFIATWLRNRKVEIIGTYLQGGQGNLSGAIVKSLHVDLPCIEEQQKIGTHFRQLDELISKHAIQLQKLKQIKSACLEKMFV